MTFVIDALLTMSPEPSSSIAKVSNRHQLLN